MSTRSNIAVQRKDGTVHSVYCHFDGYLEGVGAALLKDHNSEGAAEALVALGDLRSVSAERGVFAYARDRGEKFEDTKPVVFAEAADYFREGDARGLGDNGYRYLWRDGEWTVWGHPSREPISLAKALEAARGVE